MTSMENREWIVVTSDRDIMAHAWSCGSIPVPSDTFLLILERKGTSFQGDFDILEGDDDGHDKKGSPMRLSKRHKALMRVLKKL
jgi:hypothetical protein